MCAVRERFEEQLFGLERGVPSYPVYVHTGSTLDSLVIRAVIHRFAWITWAALLRLFRAPRSKTALTQGALEKARRIHLIGEFPLQRPRLTFQLRRDQLRP